MMQQTNPIVSSDQESLIRVDAADRVIGSASKFECHQGAGLLHRAFSVFLFNAEGHLLLQQRAAGKLLWPGYWSNSCCSHPRWNETMEDAVARRIAEELGLTAISSGPQFLYKFEYQAHFGDIGSEHELCSVFRAHSDAEPQVNATEIAAWRWIHPDQLDTELTTHPDTYTPWLHLEWKRLRRDFL